MSGKRRLPDLQVLIPYQELVALLEASDKLDDISNAYSRLQEQQEALRGQFIKLAEQFGDLRDFIKD